MLLQTANEKSLEGCIPFWCTHGPTPHFYGSVKYRWVPNGSKDVHASFCVDGCWKKPSDYSPFRSRCRDDHHACKPPLTLTIVKKVGCGWRVMQFDVLWQWRGDIQSTDVPKTTSIIGSISYRSNIFWVNRIDRAPWRTTIRCCSSFFLLCSWTNRPMNPPPPLLWSSLLSSWSPAKFLTDEPACVGKCSVLSETALRGEDNVRV